MSASELHAGDLAEYRKKLSKTRERVHLCEIISFTPRRVRILFRPDGKCPRVATVLPAKLTFVGGGLLK